MNKLPKHVAIIMDGNGRWAQQRGLPRIAGHRAGAKVVKEIVKHCGEIGIEVVTLFAFGMENQGRPSSEVDFLMQLFLQTLQRETTPLKKKNVQLRVIGDYSLFSEKLRNRIITSQNDTSNNTGLKLILAVNYSGRWDIIQAVRKLGYEIERSNLRAQQITRKMFQHELMLSDLPEPDLFIRTSGEKRLSNFFLWQLAYTELYFTDVLWPDFHVQDFEQALACYASRQRRFGLTSEQLGQLGSQYAET